MALHTQLQIYKTTYDFTALVFQYVANMERKYKRSIGERLEKLSTELVELIYRANCSRNKLPLLFELSERLQVIELMLRLAHDLRLLSHDQYARAVQLTSSIGKQNTGWRKASSASPAG
jgi:hypothetical protein